MREDEWGGGGGRSSKNGLKTVPTPNKHSVSGNGLHLGGAYCSILRHRQREVKRGPLPPPPRGMEAAPLSATGTNAVGTFPTPQRRLLTPHPPPQSPGIPMFLWDMSFGSKACK